MQPLPTSLGSLAKLAMSAWMKGILTSKANSSLTAGATVTNTTPACGSKRILVWFAQSCAINSSRKKPPLQYEFLAVGGLVRGAVPARWIAWVVSGQGRSRPARQVVSIASIPISPFTQWQPGSPSRTASAGVPTIARCIIAIRGFT